MTVYLIVGIMLFVTGMGCGKKGDPLPPKALMPLPPHDIAYTLEGDLLTLTWQLPQKGDAAPVPWKGLFTDGSLPQVQGFEIFQATRKRSQDACRGCPLMFHSIALVDASVTTYRLRINEGMTYYFKLRSLAGGDLVSDDSETLSFDH